MSDWLATVTALWLGVLTSISPCPLASNIAAISFVGRKIGRTRQILFSGLLYTAGRTLAYLALGILIMAGLLGGGDISRFLQRHLNQVLGPALILTGMLLLGLLNPAGSFHLAGTGLQKRVSGGSSWWALALGGLFALSFCPVSAGLFFGGLLPLSVKHGSRFVLPAAYGAGTALPVVIFAFLTAFACRHIGRVFNRLSQVERVVRVITGLVFIAAGIYYSLSRVYGIFQK